MSGSFALIQQSFQTAQDRLGKVVSNYDGAKKKVKKKKKTFESTITTKVKQYSENAENSTKKQLDDLVTTVNDLIDQGYSTFGSTFGPTFLGFIRLTEQSKLPFRWVKKLPSMFHGSKLYEELHEAHLTALRAQKEAECAELIALLQNEQTNRLIHSSLSSMPQIFKQNLQTAETAEELSSCLYDFLSDVYNKLDDTNFYNEMLFTAELEHAQAILSAAQDISNQQLGERGQPLTTKLKKLQKQLKEATDSFIENENFADELKHEYMQGKAAGVAAIDKIAMRAEHIMGIEQHESLDDKDTVLRQKLSKDTLAKSQLHRFLMEFFAIFFKTGNKIEKQFKPENISLPGLKTRLTTTAAKAPNVTGNLDKQHKDYAEAKAKHEARKILKLIESNNHSKAKSLLDFILGKDGDGSERQLSPFYIFLKESFEQLKTNEFGVEDNSRPLHEHLAERIDQAEQPSHTKRM